MVKKAPFGEETSSEFPHKKWWESSEDLGFSDMNIIIYIYTYRYVYVFFFLRQIESKDTARIKLHSRVPSKHPH